MKRRIISLILCLGILLSIPGQAFADNWVKTEAKGNVWVDTSHYENKPKWIDTSYWIAKRVLVPSGYWQTNRTLVSAGYWDTKTTLVTPGKYKNIQVLVKDGYWTHKKVLVKAGYYVFYRSKLIYRTGWHRYGQKNHPQRCVGY